MRRLKYLSAEADNLEIIHQGCSGLHRLRLALYAISHEIAPEYAAKYANGAVSDREYLLILLEKENFIGSRGPARGNDFIVVRPIEFVVSGDDHLRKRTGEVC